jgi:hypothetical protein
VAGVGRLRRRLRHRIAGHRPAQPVDAARHIYERVRAAEAAGLLDRRHVRLASGGAFLDALLGCRVR